MVCAFAQQRRLSRQIAGASSGFCASLLPGLFNEKAPKVFGAFS
jgi:hypothetical protein